ncbi:Fur family transcriptional regulator [Streptomyces sp. NBC_00715]|uniref:Fur family transcriptional regulator n=1 Tax=Streptomyces sp. NBC_00715 TaxID=2975811 RepID=UPI003869789A
MRCGVRPRTTAGRRSERCGGGRGRTRKGGRVNGKTPGEPGRAATLLRDRGLRVTSNRLQTLELLSRSGAHLSSAEVHNALRRMGERVDPATVYRSLEALAEVGLVHAIEGPGPKRYGEGSEPHHHAVCHECGTMKDIPLEGLAGVARHIEELTGLRPDVGGAMLFHGLCGICAA